MGCVRERGVYRVREIELSVAVRVGTRKLEERPGRRMQYVRLRRRRAGKRSPKHEFQSQLLHSRKCNSKWQGPGAVPAQAVAALVPLRGRANHGEFHGSLPDGVSPDAGPPAIGALAGAASLPAAGRANRRCCFSCWRAFLVSSLCLRAWW